MIRRNPVCPNCEAMLDGFTGINTDENPGPGSLTVCAYCGTALEYDNALQLRKASEELIHSLDLPTRIALERAVRVVKEMKVKRRFL